MTKKATLIGYPRVMSSFKRKFTEERQQDIILFAIKNSQNSIYPINVEPLAFEVKEYEYEKFDIINMSKKSF